MDNQANQPQPLPEQEPQTQPLPPANNPAPVGPVPLATGPKKSKTGLFVGLGILVVVIVALVIGFFVIKGNGDTAAASYNKDLTSYISKLSEATGSSSTSAELTRTFDAQPPKLNDVFLGSLSGNYSDAQKTRDAASDKVSGFKDRATQIVNLVNYPTGINDLATKIRATTNGVSASSAQADKNEAFDKVLELLKEARDYSQEQKLPANYASDKQALKAAYDAEVIAWEKLTTAFKVQDSAAYASAYAEFQAAANKESTALATMRTKVMGNVDELQQSLTKDITAYKDQINK